MLSKTRVINAIMQLNRSAPPDWLNNFAVPALRKYLDHLEIALEPRGRASVWIRSPNTPPFVTRDPCW